MSEEMDLGLPTPEEPKADYVVSALKYRPQTFGDLTGQENVARALTRAIVEDRVPHALLFAGPRGVGKTSSARILAKSLNCAEGPTPEPCGNCEHCRGIANGSDMDVIEIDGASNTGIDNIRELRERVNYAAFSARWKVYIVDEVHMLSNAAFNALLKTLEEPPPRVVFVFATTELDKVPETIRSRCTVFQLGRIGAEALIQRLDYVVSHEPEIQIVDDDRHAVLQAIADSAEGGMRDALVTLDQLAALSDGPVSIDDARRLLGMVEQSLLVNLLDGLLEHKTKELLLKVDELAASGQDFEKLTKTVCRFLRDVMIVRTVGADSGLVDATGERLNSMAQQAAKASHEQLLQFTRAFLDLEAEMKSAAQPRILLEYTLIKLTVIDPVAPIESLMKRLDAIGSGAAGAAPGAPVGASATEAKAADWLPTDEAPSAPVEAKPVAQTSSPAPAADSFDEFMPAPSVSKPAPAQAKPEPTTTPASPEMSKDDKRDASDLAGVWEALNQAISTRSLPLANSLKDCRPISIDKRGLRVALAAGDHFLYDKGAIERAPSQRMMGEALEAITGKLLRVIVEEDGAQTAKPSPPPVVDKPVKAQPLAPPPAPSFTSPPSDFDHVAPEAEYDLPEPPPEARQAKPPPPAPPTPTQAPAPPVSNDPFAALNVADPGMERLARLAESPSAKLERLKNADPEFAKALDLVARSFNGEVTKVDDRPIR